MPSLTIERLSRHFGGVRAVDDLSLRVEEGEMLTLLGPSGCGKTTTLRCLAGLERPTGGRILIGDEVVTAIAEGVFVPPEKRQIGMVFQSYAVWPHMTVFENVAYPLRARGVPGQDIPAKVARALKQVRLENLGERFSTQLSGGQQQRVALARSFVSEPSLLLFDEPLSNLDANLRVQMRLELRELQERLGFTAVYVTHDQSEAMALSDRIAIMDQGLLQQVGPPREIYDRPRNRFVAGFMGATNLFEGTAEGERDGRLIIRTEEGLRMAASRRNAPAGGRTYVSVRPEALRLSGGEEGRGPVNCWPAKVQHSTFLGDSIVYRVEAAGRSIEVHSPPTQAFEVGVNVLISADPDRCIVVEA